MTFKSLAYLPIFTLAGSAIAQSLSNQGLVGYASLPASDRDFLGDTLGGVGSAAAIFPGTFKKNPDGTYSGRLVGAPDRGHNTQGTTDYFGRHQFFDFTLDPFYGDTVNGAVGSLEVTYAGGQLYTDPGAVNGRTTGLDPTGVRYATGAFPDVPIAGANSAISLDQEGIAFLADGSFYASDEYGPYIYRISNSGAILGAIQPPRAIVPLDANGDYYFTSEADPVTGRVANQGFEGLTISPDQKSLYAMLQSGTVQDGGTTDFRSKWTRIFHYDISQPEEPELVGEWVVESPASNSGQGRAVSELYYLSETSFLALYRDGDGNGNGDPPAPSNGDLKSDLKNIGIVDISGATNIANTEYDEPTSPVAPGGVLASGITAAPWSPFLSIIDDAQLAKAGLNNGRPQLTDIVGKYESIALASVLEPENPDDYFVFTLADNDFITADGIQDGVPYSDPYASGTGIDVPNQMLVFRVTIPGATIPSYINAPVLSPSLNAARARARRAEGAKRLPNTF